jgi:ABC-2 type transport system permease protein
MNTFKALVKREYWEHRGGIFIAPATIAAIFAGLILLGALTGNAFIDVDNENSISLSEKLPEAVQHLEAMPEELRDKGIQVAMQSPVMLFGGIMLVISLFYGLGALYDERKDRSILFWKSLPVSDTATVLSKLVCMVLVFPISFYLVVSAFQLFMLLFATIAAWFSGSLGGIIWTSSNLFAISFNTLMSLIVASLWLAPVWSWLLLASSWAKKVPFLWAWLPVVVVGVAEAWIFSTSRFFEMVGLHIGKGFAIQNSNLHFLNDGDLFDVSVLTWFEALVNSEFWIGILIAAILLAATIYTRRYKDES